MIRFVARRKLDMRERNSPSVNPMNQRRRVISQNIANYDSEWSAREYTREQGLRPLEGECVDRFFPPPPARVLDVGCGAGRTSIGLSKRGFEVVAIDLSGTLLELAREQFPTLDFRRMDATRLEFDDGSFDAVLFSYNGIDCIYPLADRLQCMAEMYRVLRPGGLLMISTHNIVGAVFSGGYFYWKGYWNAGRMLLSQWNNPRSLQWFVKYHDGGGPQFLYSAPPRHTQRQLESVGFDVVHSCGISGETDRRRILMHHQHVHFVARRPTNS